jgi:hypothetical protein
MRYKEGDVFTLKTFTSNLKNILHWQNYIVLVFLSMCKVPVSMRLLVRSLYTGIWQFWQYDNFQIAGRIGLLWWLRKIKTCIMLNQNHRMDMLDHQFHFPSKCQLRWTISYAGALSLRFLIRNRSSGTGSLTGNFFILVDFI